MGQAGLLIDPLAPSLSPKSTARVPPGHTGMGGPVQGCGEDMKVVFCLSVKLHGWWR